MADMTIQIPSDRVDAVRRALLHTYAGIADALHYAAAAMASGSVPEDCTHGPRIELADAGDALEQMGWALVPASEPLELTAHPELLSDVFGQAVLDALDRFEEAMRDLSKGNEEPTIARRALEDLCVTFRLFEVSRGA